MHPPDSKAEALSSRMKDGRFGRSKRGCAPADPGEANGIFAGIMRLGGHECCYSTAAPRTTKKILIATFKMASKTGTIFNRLALTEAVIFLLIEAVTINHLAKSINRGGHYKNNGHS